MSKAIYEQFWVYTIVTAALAGALSARSLPAQSPAPNAPIIVADRLAGDTQATVAAVGAPPSDEDLSVRRLPQVTEIPESVAAPPVIGPANGSSAGPSYTIDLLAALRLADRANPDVGISRQAIAESLARQQGARVLLLPSLTGGTNYHWHTGNLQQNDGSMLLTTQQALYVGGGAGNALGSQTLANPAIRVFGHLGDAIFEPLAARQRVTTRRFDAGATFNSVLLNVSIAYLELMAAEAQFEVLHRSQLDAAAFVRVTRRFAEEGQGRLADFHRANAESRLIDSQIQGANERIAVSAANLARLLSLDPAVRLKTIGGPIPVLLLVDHRLSREQLIDVALRHRPEVAAREAQIAEAETRFRQERLRPLFPTVSLGFSAGSFGGGSNTSTPSFGDFGGRTDFDAFAFWTMQNLGAGNLARARGRRAQTEQAIWTRAGVVNQVRREVAEAFAQSEAAKQQIDISEQRLIEAEDGFREEFARIRGGEGLPIELLDNLTRAIAARQVIVTTITAYDMAQFRLFVALGQPPTSACPNLQPLSRPEGG